MEGDLSSSDASAKRPLAKDSVQLTLQLAESLSSAQSANEMREIGDALTQQVSHKLDLANRRISDQISYLRSERDNARGKHKTFADEIQRLKRQIEVIQTEYKLVDRARIKSLQQQLQAAISDRDTWKDRAEQLDDVCETLKLVHTLQRSVSKEGEIHREHIAKEQELEKLVKQHKKKATYLSLELEKSIQECNKATSECNAAVTQLHKMEQDLRKAKEAERWAVVQYQEAEQKSSRLERVVEALQTRLTAAGGVHGSSKSFIGGQSLPPSFTSQSSRMDWPQIPLGEI